KVGDCFTLDKWVAAREARMQVYVPLSDYSYQNLVYIAAKISELRNSGHIEWVEDPTEINPTHIISWHQSYWQLETLNESAIQPVKLGRNPGNALILNEIIKNSAGKNRTPRVFLQLPLSVEMARALGLEMNDYNRSVEMSSSLEGSHYILVGRLLPSQNTMAQQFNQDSGVSLQYAWVLPNMTQEPGQDFSLPVRTGWISFEKKESFQEMAGKLTDNILQLVRIRGWQQLVSPPGNDWFPYQLGLKNAETGEIKTTGPLKKGETYGLVLTADGNRLESLENIEKRYVYVFSIDSFGRGTLLFPRGVWGNAENYFPLTINDNEVDGHKQKFFRGSRGAIFQKSPPGEIKLGSKKLFEVSEPYGRDTFILLTTTDAISRPEVLDFSGVRKEEIIGLSPLEELLYDLNSEDRKPRSRPMIMNWSIARLPILSQPN
ncbi:MAG: hypothetical protein QG657_2654, partial [Acidobacteriota bacterium]|nr:hypothetical protein [Acidobacteriota bacterium]